MVPILKRRKGKTLEFKRGISVPQSALRIGHSSGSSSRSAHHLELG